MREEDGNSNINYSIPDPEMSHSHPEIYSSYIGAYTSDKMIDGITYIYSQIVLFVDNQISIRI